MGSVGYNAKDCVWSIPHNHTTILKALLTSHVADKYGYNYISKNHLQRYDMVRENEQHQAISHVESCTPHTSPVLPQPLHGAEMRAHSFIAIDIQEYDRRKGHCCELLPKMFVSSDQS